jgi:hypothetical protein
MRRVRGYMEGFGLNAISCLRRGQTIGKANGLVRDLIERFGSHITGLLTNRGTPRPLAAL